MAVVQQNPTFSGALQAISPLALSMAQGLKSGQGAQAYMGQGLAAMMAQQDKRKEEATSKQLDAMLEGMNLPASERALISSMDLGGKQNYLANLMMYNRQQSNRVGRQPSQGELASSFFASMGDGHPSQQPLSGDFVTGGGLSFGTKSPGETDMPQGDVGASMLRNGGPGTLGANLLPPTEAPVGGMSAPPAGMPGMAGASPAPPPVTASPPTTPMRMPNEPQGSRVFNFANQPQQAQSAASPVAQRIQQIDQRILQAQELAMRGDRRAQAALGVLTQQRNALQGMLPEQAEDPIAKERALFQWAMENGAETPEAAMAFARSGQTINVNTGDTGPQVGTIPQGFQMMRDPETGAFSMQPIPGGPEDTTQEDALAEEAKTTSKKLVLDEINIARDLIEDQSLTSPATGILGSAASRIDSTRAGALKNRLTTIKANIGFDKLQAMRDASPTGGALGQVSEFENRLLQAVYGSLEQAQRAEDIVYNLDRLERIYNRIIDEGIPEDEARAMYRDITSGEFMSGSDADDIPTYNPQTGLWE